MQEYWVNVYAFGIKYTYQSRQMAFFEGCIQRKYGFPLYRIHVKMKRFIRIRLPNDFLVKETKLRLNNVDKLNWME